MAQGNGFTPEKPVITAACGYSFSVFVDSDFEAWVQGSNYHLANSLCDYNSIKQLPGLPPINNIACGDFSIILVDDEGNLWGCGKNDFGQLGMGHKNKVELPTQIPNITNVSQVVCGDDHSVALTNQGDIFACGSNLLGQCGLGEEETRVQSFKPVKNLSNIHYISACGYHTLFLNTSGEVFSVGNNGSGELGHGNRDKLKIAKKIKALPEIRIIATKLYGSIFIDVSGKIWVCGCNSNRELGIVGNQDIYTPTIIPTIKDRDIQFVSEGGKTTVIKDSEGTVWCFGGSTFTNEVAWRDIPVELPSKYSKLIGVPAEFCRAKSAKK